MQTTPEFERQLRSLFAILRTLVRQTVEGRTSVEDYAAHLEGRIGCLARAHAMVLRAPEEGVDLHEMLCGELLAQTVREDRYQLAGPEIRIGRESVTTIALAFHELIMNSLLHGALARAPGTVQVEWRAIGDDGSQNLHFEWRERGAGLQNTVPTHKGFGMELLERMLPYELNAWPNIGYSPEGVHVELHIPAGASAATWRLAPLR